MHVYMYDVSQEFCTPEKGNSPRVSTVIVRGDDPVVKEARANDHTHLTTSGNSLLASNDNNLATLSHTPSEPVSPDKLVLNPSDKTVMKYNSFFTSGPTKIEMTQSANFLGGPPNEGEEEGTSAGCGRLEGSIKSQQEGVSGDVMGLSQLTPKGKGHPESPPLSLNMAGSGQGSSGHSFAPGKGYNTLMVYIGTSLLGHP